MFFMDRTKRMECGPAPARHDQATISFLFYFFFLMTQRIILPRSDGLSIFLLEKCKNFTKSRSRRTDPTFSRAG